MRKNIVRSLSVIVVAVMLVFTVAAVFKVKSYCNVGTCIGGFRLTGREVIINTKSGGVRKVNTNKTELVTTQENDLYLITDGHTEFIKSDSIKSVDGGNTLLVLELGQWSRKVHGR